MDQVLTEESAPSVAAPAAAPAPAAVPDISRLRPRIRHDVVFAETGEGAFLRHAESGFVIKGRTAYRWIAALLPHFTGEHTVAELSAGLGEQQRDLITSMVATLLERGFVRDGTALNDAEIPAAVRERYRSQLNFVDHYTNGAAARFARFRAATVLVAGSVPAAVAAAESLLRNGMEQVTVRLEEGAGAADLARLTTEADTATAAGAPARVSPATEPLSGLRDEQLGSYDVIVTFADRGRTGEAVALARRLPAGPAMLPVTVAGNRVILGPVTRAGAAPCLICALLRLGANIPAGEMADLWRGAGLPELPAPGALGADVTARMIGNAAAFDVFRLLTGTLPAETEGAVVVQDLQTLDAVRERLLPHPRCPVCRAWQDGGTPEPAAGLGAEEQLQRLFRPMAKHVGVYTEFDDRWIGQSPVKVGRVRVGSPGLVAGPGRTVCAFDTDSTAGARRRALYLAAQVYLAQVADPAEEVSAPPSGTRVIPARALLTCTGPAAAPAGRWLAATSLRSGERCYVPAGAVHPGGQDPAAACFEATSAGWGTGPDEASAIAAGTGSALAYHALRRALAGHPARELVLPAPVAEDSPAGFLARAAGHYGIAPRLYLLPGVTGFPVLAAVGVLGTPPGQDLAGWSVGWGQDAVCDVLRDLVGQQQLDEAGADADLGDPLVAQLHPGSLRTEAGAQPAPLPTGAGLDAAGGFPGVLAAAGLDALVVDVTTPDLRGTSVVSAVRVLLAEADGSR
jgi:bacteriocin biosynthesis cyclodehydratase domain-containing protein